MTSTLQPGQQDDHEESGQSPSDGFSGTRTRTEGSRCGSRPLQSNRSLVTLMGGGDLESHPLPDSSQKPESAFEVPQKHSGGRNPDYVPWPRYWRWELAAVTFSLACLAAVTAVLLAADRKTLAEWKFSIRPNALVAVFNTLSESAMLFVVAECVGQLKWIHFQQSDQRMFDFQIFDDASRGPIGSLRLLAKIHRRALVASVFALLTISSLASDPFAQQIFHFKNLNVPHSDGTASIPMANALQTSLSSGSLGSGLLHGLVPPLHAFYSGLFTSESQTDFTCTSGNCTWPAFQTMSVCSHCTNVTKNVKGSYSLQPDNGSTNALFAEFVTPKGFRLRYSYDYSNSDPMARLMSAARHANECSPTSEDGSCYMSPLEIAVGRLSFDYFSNLPSNNQGVVETSKLVTPPIYECSIYYCETTRSVEVKNGRLHDNVTKTLPLSFSKLMHKDCNDSCDAWFEPPYPDGKRYALGYINAHWISMMLQGFFGQQVTDLVPEQVYTSTTAALWWRHDGDIPSTVRDITEGLTTYIRQGPNRTELGGTAMVPEIVINVEWPWFILPLILVLLTTALLIITIISSAKSSTVIWKSSTLALMFHGLRDWNGKKMSLAFLDQMKLTAKETWVALSKDEDGNMALYRVRQGVR